MTLQFLLWKIDPVFRPLGSSTVSLLFFCLPINSVYLYYGFPGSSAGKESTYNAGDLGSILGQEDPLEKETGKPLQRPCLENAMNRGVWRAAVFGVTKSWARLSDQHLLSLYDGTHNTDCNRSLIYPYPPSQTTSLVKTAPISWHWLNVWKLIMRLHLTTACMHAKSLQSRPTLRPHGEQPTRLLRSRDSPGNTTGVGCHFLLRNNCILTLV